jgi:hypothetical protein
VRSPYNPSPTGRRLHQRALPGTGIMCSSGRMVHCSTEIQATARVPTGSTEVRDCRPGGPTPPGPQVNGRRAVKRGRLFSTVIVQLGSMLGGCIT